MAGLQEIGGKCEAAATENLQSCHGAGFDTSSATENLQSCHIDAYGRVTNTQGIRHTHSVSFAMVADCRLTLRFPFRQRISSMRRLAVPSSFSVTS